MTSARPQLCWLVLICLALAPSSYALDLKKLLEGVKIPETSQASGVAALSQGEIGKGLKEALSQGVQRAIKSLGKTDGYLGNPKVKIPIPDSLRSVESGLRAVGQNQYADQFVTAMNRAAERAVPEAASIFGSAISKMTLDDARKLLNGPDNAATDYFRRTSTDDLIARFRPIVEQTTKSVGVTSAYKDLVGRAGFVGQLLGKDTTDIDGYVTNQAVGGLFTLIAAEEKRIRTQPIARTTELLRKVFE